MSKLFTRATVSSATLTGANLKATLTALWDALNSGGFTDSSRTTITATATLATTQCGLLLVDATAGNITLTLPASGPATDDAFYNLRRIDSTANVVTVQRAGADTVEGGTSITLPINSATELQLPGGSVNWRVFGIGGPTAAATRTALGAAASGANSDITSLAILPGYLFGCTMSTAGASATMSIAAGRAQDSTGVQLMTLTAIAKTTAAWAVGTAAGGLDTGAIANSTWYHWFVIRRPDTGVVDALCSLSPTAPTLPTNYTQFRRIGSGKTNGSAQWASFIQDGDYFRWLTSVADVIASTNTGTVAQTATLSTPPGVTTIADMNIRIVDTAAAGYSLLLSDLAATDEFPTAGGASPYAHALTSVANISAVAKVQIRTNTSSQVRFRVNGSVATTVVSITTNGWIDTRGRNA